MVIASVGFVVGCSNADKETISSVKNNLKDPESAQFQNVKGYCGEVNAKNSYGGYDGFKRFISVDENTVIESDDGDPLEFALGVEAYCTKNESSNQERAQCIVDAKTAVVALKAKANGVPLNKVKQSINIASGEKENSKHLDKVIEDAYVTKFNNPDMYALEVVNNCLKH